MNKFLTCFFGICLFISCDNAKEKTKEALNKTGETVGQSASEFAKGVKTGVEKTFEYSVVLSDDLKAKGLETGKLLVSAGEAKSDNILSVYFIFLKDFKGTVSIKVYDEKGEEYGRTSIETEGKKGQAFYTDFIFDKRTDIESKSKFVIE